MTSAVLALDGRALAAEIRGEVAADLAEGIDLCPVLVAVLVGGDAEAKAALWLKQEAGAEVGVAVSPSELPATASQAEVEALVDELSVDPGVHAIFVHLPLPRGLDEAAVLQRVPAVKDVDGMSCGWRDRLRRHGAPSAPAGAEAALRLVERDGVGLAGQRVRLVGCPPYLREPLELLLAREGAVVAEDGTVVVDLGVPGGIGPVTVALLLERTARAAAAGRTER